MHIFNNENVTIKFVYLITAVLYIVILECIILSNILLTMNLSLKFNNLIIKYNFK